MRVRAVLFDFDGTLTKPGCIDFSEIRRRVGAREGIPILEFIAGLSDEKERSSATAILEESEAAAAAESGPNPGAEELVRFLKRLSIRVGIITRNSRRSVDVSFRNFAEISAEDFDVILTRDDVVRQKPDPEGVLTAARIMNVCPGEMLVIGDYVFDIDAGRGAGAMTVYLDNMDKSKVPDPPADYTVNDLAELRALLESLLR